MSKLRQLITELETLTGNKVVLKENVSGKVKDYLKNISYKDLTLNDGPESGGEVKLLISTPKVNIEKYVELNLEGTRLGLNQIHIFLNPEIQGLGLGEKIYKRVIEEFGYIYSGKGRQQNQTQIPKIWNKLKNDPNIEVFENALGMLAVLKGSFDWKDEILDQFGL